MAEENSSDLAREIQKALEERTQRSTQDYDGIVGSLPEWIPELTVKEFESTRDFLLEKYAHKEIKRCLAARSRMAVESRFSFIPNLLFDIQDQVDTLLHIQWIVRLGMDKGLEELLGKEHNADRERGKKVVEGGKKGHARAHGTLQDKKED